jgi:hypothetical protein
MTGEESKICGWVAGRFAEIGRKLLSGTANVDGKIETGERLEVGAKDKKAAQMVKSCVSRLCELRRGLIAVVMNASARKVGYQI